MFLQTAKKTDFFEVALFRVKFGPFITNLFKPKTCCVLKLVLLCTILFAPIDL